MYDVATRDLARTFFGQKRQHIERVASGRRPHHGRPTDTPARRAFWRRLFTHMGVRTHAGGTADRVHAQREHDLLLDGPPAS